MSDNAKLKVNAKYFFRHFSLTKIPKNQMAQTMSNNATLNINAKYISR